MSKITVEIGEGLDTCTTTTEGVGGFSDEPGDGRNGIQNGMRDARFNVLQTIKDLREKRGQKKLAQRLGLPILVGIEDLDVDEERIKPNSEALAQAQRAIRRAEAEQESFGKRLVKSYLAKYGYSDIFATVQAGNKFADAYIGRNVIIDGREIVINKEIINLLRINFTIGTPPVTERALKLFRSMLLGNANPSEIIEIGRIINVDIQDLTDLVEELARSVEWDTGYMTASQESQHFDGMNRHSSALAGTEDMYRTMVSGGPKRAERIVRDYVFRTRKEKIEVMQTNEINPGLIDTIERERDKVFVLHIDGVPRYFTERTELGARWAAQMGRIILIDHCRDAERGGFSYIMTVWRGVKETAAIAHTNISGRPSSTQAVLREIMAQFGSEFYDDLYAKAYTKFEDLSEKIKEISYDNPEGLSGDDEEAETLMADWYSLRQFLLTLEEISKIESLDDNTFQAHSVEKRGTLARNWGKYLYNNLHKKGYKGVVGNGGGREGLHSIGLYKHHKIQQAARMDTEAIRKRMQRTTVGARVLEDDRGLTARAGVVEEEEGMPITGNSVFDTVRAKEARRRMGSADIRRAGSVRGAGRRAVYELAGRATNGLSRISEGLQSILANGVDHLAMDQNKSAKLLADLEIYIHQRVFQERLGLFRGDEDGDDDNVVSRLTEMLGRDVWGRMLIPVAKKLYKALFYRIERPERKPEKIEQILGMIERGKEIPGKLIVEAVGWSYGNVYEEHQFPEHEAIIVEVQRLPDGEPDIAGLRRELLRMEAELADAPEVFKLLCDSMIWTVNTPHNPTGKILRETHILGLLDVAADFGITVVDDSSYFKMFRKREGDRGRPHYPPVAEIYERHRTLFLNREVDIFTVATPTKNQEAAGGRLNMVLTKNLEAQEFLETEAQKSTPNLLAIHYLEQKFRHGITVKKIDDVLGDMIATTSYTKNLDACIVLFKQRLGLSGIRGSGMSYEAYSLIKNAYYLLCDLTGREGTYKDGIEVLEDLRKDLKATRADKASAMDADKRFEVASEAITKVLEVNCKKEAAEFKTTIPNHIGVVDPDGAFYMGVELPYTGPYRHGVQKFLEILNERTGVGFVRMTENYIRISLGDKIEGSEKSYKALGKKLEIGLTVLYRHWFLAQRFRTLRDFDKFLAVRNLNDDALSALLDERADLLEGYGKKKRGVAIVGETNHYAHKIEYRSDAVDIIVEGAACNNTSNFLKSAPFEAIYRFIVRNYYGQINDTELQRKSPDEILREYPPSLIRNAYNKVDSGQTQQEKHRVAEICSLIYIAWYRQDVRTNVFMACNKGERGSALVRDASDQIGKFIAEMYNSVVRRPADGEEKDPMHGFASGYSIYKHNDLENRVRPNEDATGHMKTAINNCDFIAESPLTRPQTSSVTAAKKRLHGREYSFDKVEGQEADKIKEKFNSPQFEEIMRTGEYVCKAVQVGAVRQLLVINKAYLHQLRDEARLFPGLREVTEHEHLDQSKFDTVLYFGLPKKFIGEHHMTGYFVDEENGQKTPTAWVGRADTTDYVGFLKKMMMALHNEKIIEEGGVPIHGSMFTINFKDGREFTMVGCGDSGVGKSEMLAQILIMLDEKGIDVREIENIEILAGDMLSLHKGRDEERIERVFGLGTETGDFMRMDDLIGTPFENIYWYLLRKGSITNAGEPNERVTVPNICRKSGVLRPKEINGFFYFNNYTIPTSNNAFEISNVRETFQNLARGQRINLGTTGELPDIDSSVANSTNREKAELALRGRNYFSTFLRWNRAKDREGNREIYLSYDQASKSLSTARRRVEQLFLGETSYYKLEDINTENGSRWASLRVESVEYNKKENVFYLLGEGERVPLTLDTFSPLVEKVVNPDTRYYEVVPEDRWLYEELNHGDPLYQRLSSTYFANLFGVNSNPEKYEENVEEITRVMEATGVLGGVIYTQLGRAGRQEEGTHLAGQCLIRELVRDENTPQKQKNMKARVQSGVQAKLARANVSEVPKNEVMARNMRILRKHNNRSIRLNNKNVRTPLMPTNDDIKQENVLFDVVPPAVRDGLESVLLNRETGEYKRPDATSRIDVSKNCDKYKPFLIDAFDRIEMIYQIMLKDGRISTSTELSDIRDIYIWEAAKIADSIAANENIPLARAV